MRALIIDDDPVNRLYLQEVLSSYADTASAESGELGLELFRKSMHTSRAFDAVLLDVQMPGMDGHQTLRKIRGMERDAGLTPAEESTVLMISGSGGSQDIKRAFFQGGALSYLTKPVDPDQLIDELRKLGLIV
ncbi:response regulator [Fundidesulfovibrio soli]|uniref:response regulator n=1 Tax=Fundidesulfovibrio soli TaxID=2922716 RepID=UPI001FAF1CDC|nr:response regulator [Fundidesulfovibrio soli]